MKLILPDEEVLEYNERILKGYGDEIALHREELRNEIADHLEIDAGQSFIMSGHQVSFFHPGILIKDTQAAAIALRNYGQAIHVSLSKRSCHGLIRISLNFRRCASSRFVHDLLNNS